MTAFALTPADHTRRFRRAFAACALMVLAVPLVAMGFTADVDWGAGDFLAAGTLLALLGAGLDLALRLPGSLTLRAGAAALTLAAFLLVWAELAVGILD